MILIRFKLYFFLAICVGYAPSIGAGLLDKDGMADWEICAMCHGADGISHMAKFPKLAGQKADYISKQLKDFYWQRRTNDGGQMQAITTEIDLKNVDAVASYFAQLPPSAAAQLSDDPASQQLFDDGEKVFWQSANGTDSCATCHHPSASVRAEKNSASGAGVMVAAPILFAQHEAYLVKQLNDFKTNVRKNDSTKSMNIVAKNLDTQSIQAVAFYLAHRQQNDEKK